METTQTRSPRVRVRGLRAGAVAIVAIAAAAFAQTVSDTFDRSHENGLVTLRFHRGRFHHALVLDDRLHQKAPPHIVTARGRRIAFQWSSRSVWIERAKYELPFGAVFLVSTRDTIRVRQLEFSAVRGRLLLEQAADAAPVTVWLREQGDPRGAVVRGAVEAATYPRHTLEMTEWSYRGVNAVTCVVSGDPLFVILSKAPLDAGGSEQTAFGNLRTVDVHVGPADARRTWRATPLQATFLERTYDLARGRVFLISSSAAEVTQVAAKLDLGPESAARLADEIERLPEVRTFLRLEQPDP